MGSMGSLSCFTHKLEILEELTVCNCAIISVLSTVVLYVLHNLYSTEIFYSTEILILSELVFM